MWKEVKVNLFLTWFAIIPSGFETFIKANYLGGSKRERDEDFNVKSSLNILLVSRNENYIYLIESAFES